uniref:PREDICTED: similar to predicted protein putative n=1 Tax=Albugo laibachii Nc14 TaxID=890382 RepID=F0WXC5_9STRA|nr:PREDICTED: similar to predicted protein putative [Albugo laibachii Nc14]|eukprot:CCA26117.1 PREDICTED: similar to predicted protein putative [Albugo laibachii Nc14]
MAFAHQHHVEKMQFQQDGASCHRARDTIVFFKDQGVIVVEHPALSPELNPIENLWGVLARAVYRDGHQFMSKNDLKSTKCQIDALKLYNAGELKRAFSEQQQRRIHNAINDFI